MGHLRGLQFDKTCRCLLRSSIPVARPGSPLQHEMMALTEPASMSTLTAAEATSARAGEYSNA